jgi:hypothetical protein
VMRRSNLDELADLDGVPLYDLKLTVSMRRGAVPGVG